jgi:hypothetical protein
MIELEPKTSGLRLAPKEIKMQKLIETGQPMRQTNGHG